MTWGVDAKTTDATQIVARGADAGVDPGKRSATGLTPWEAKGSACEVDAKQPGCLLSDAQRGRVIGSLRERIIVVSSIYQSAINAVRVAKLLEKDVDVTWVFSLMMDVAAGALASTVTSTLLAIRTNKISTHFAYDHIADAGGSPWAKVSEAALAAGVATAMSGAKAAVAGAVRSRKQAAQASEKSDTQEFLMDLLHQTAIGFEHLRDGLAAGALDEALVVYDESFSAEYHDQRTYEQAIQKKVDDYHASGASRIGKTAKTGGWQGRSGDGTPLDSENIGVVWLDYASRYRSRLAYTSYQGSWAKGDETKVQSWQGGNLPATGIPNARLDQNARASDGKFLVPEEFEETARERHRILWGDEPKRQFVDDSSFYWEPERAALAKAEMAKRSSSPPNKAVPSLDLKPSTPVATASKPEPVTAPIVVPDALKLKPDVGDAP